MPLAVATGLGLLSFTFNHEVVRSAFLSLEIFQTATATTTLSAVEERHIMPAVVHESKNNHTMTEESIDNHTATQSSSLAPKHGDLFAPGSLQMTKSESLKLCYMDPQKYRHHMHKRRKCSVSKEYKLVYFMVAKAGSSTARTVMKQSFHATENWCTGNFTNDAGWSRFTFVRNPFSRFISSYQEMVKRVWAQGQTIPEQYGSFMAPYPTKSSAKNMTEQERTRAFLQFVEDYDAAMPFDGHLRLQTPRLMRNGGRAFELDTILDTHEMDEHWISIAKRVHAPIPKALHAYSRGTLLNVTMIVRTARRKMCQLSALDYCCLNYPLPPECMPRQDDNGKEVEDIVQCRWIMKPGYSNQLLIEDVSPYPPAVG
jgi:Sulfotransferase family